MEREAVISSNIASIGYDPISETLEVEFVKTGKVYEYYNVQQFIYDQLMAAPSVGQFFNASIKGSYPFNPL
ncbi:KTSC domain-containing protein [Xanthomonas arboricola]|uniref:KTSC domain-containing protein n=1 Tax=Xanthomonas arboricola TaxID=56448 RepID=UPI000CEDA08C|nr:KTSC domain-containing protein [Xanthomonas arboricola]PPT62024.1 KTSC domain-containing protein [Xanthomonas arboricola]